MKKEGARTQGLPKAHFPLIIAAMEAFAAVTRESTMYTPYLFGNVVLVPFYGVSELLLLQEGEVTPELHLPTQ